MTPAELQQKLYQLIKLPAETEWVEFKEAKTSFDFDKLGEYFSALSNEANLKGQGRPQEVQPGFYINRGRMLQIS